ncbi:bag family molecular chaperone regulator 5 mitochondrial, partial [Phtheirospermum japonicum]
AGLDFPLPPPPPQSYTLTVTTAQPLRPSPKSPISPSSRHRRKPSRQLFPSPNLENPPPPLRFSPPTDLTPSDSEANHWQRLIQRQETVDAVRTSQREQIKMNEALMGLLFRLDSVPGLDPNVRELRRHVSRKIVGLQEILDAVSDTRVEHWDGFLRDWDDIVAKIEKQVCEEKGGGDEMERFCAEHLGF